MDGTAYYLGIILGGYLVAVFLLGVGVSTLGFWMAGML